MAKPYTVSITNGEGTLNVLNDTYSVTANVNGYDNSSIEPVFVKVEDGVETYNFLISATGSLTLHVTETGEQTGVSVIGATFYRTDSEGNQYGPLFTTDSSGNAIITNVPFSETDAPIIYYKQVSSDGNHNFDSTVKNITLDTQTKTVEITNSLAALKIFKLQDKNYEGLNVQTGTINLS